MKNRGHFIVSMVKSVVRGMFAVVALLSKSWETLAVGIIIAEILGVVEEIAND